ncbi:MAG: ABC transporter permease [Candidatus Altiarchaeota archaeon]|nr:ABC transporter permease [Candidatus Altiarchaeota archaeon]
MTIKSGVHFFELVGKFISHRKRRSILTTLGIAIGVALIFSLISINKGMVTYVEGSIDDMGGNIVTIMPKLGGPSGLSSYFTKEEVEAVRSLGFVKAAAGIYATVLPVELRSGEEFVGVYGYDSEALSAVVNDIQTFKVERGRFMKDSEIQKVVLGYLIAKDNNLGLGSLLEIDGFNFRVIGILEKIGNSDDDNSINVNVKDLWDITGETDQYNFILATVVEPKEDVIIRTIERIRGREDFEVMTPESMMKAFNQILGTVSAVFIAIAGISIIAGSVGVANTMYMAVFERTREIGVMKAIGAGEWDILAIFLLESGLLSLIGGLFGVAFGLLIATGFGYVAEVSMGTDALSPAFTSDVYIISLGLAFVVGILSGFFPARYASKLEPVEALRYE